VEKEGSGVAMVTGDKHLQQDGPGTRLVDGQPCAIREVTLNRMRQHDTLLTFSK